MAYNITYLNQIVADLGGSDTYIYEIDALNAICTLLGITAGHTYKIDAMNAIEVNQGGSGGHKYNIDALNSIITLAGETAGYTYEPLAWAAIQQGALLNPFEEEYNLILAAMTTEPISADKSIQNKLVKDLKDGGIWSKGEIFDMFSVHSDDSALINWINPGAFNPAKNGTPRFLKYAGYLPSSSNNIRLNYIPNSDKVRISQNDITVIIGIGDNTALGVDDLGSFSGNDVGRLSIRARHTDNKSYFRVNAGAFGDPVNSDSIKYYTIRRTASGTFDGWLNKTKTEYSGVSNALSSKELYAGGSNENDVIKYSNRSIRFVWISSYLTDEEVVTFIDSIERYLKNNYTNLIDYTQNIAVVNPASRTLMPLTTYDGSGETVHPSVVDCGADWNGYRYWMANTPYPASNSGYENPSVWASADAVTWVVPDGLTNPIVAKPAAGYNADTCIYYEAGTMYVFYKESTGYGKIIKVTKSTNGTTWSTPTVCLSTATDETECVSPSIVKVGSLYYMYYSKYQPTPQVEFKVRRASCATIDGTYAGKVDISVPDDQYTNNYVWWHTDVKYINGKYYMSSVSAQGSNVGSKVFIFISDDGISFKKSIYANINTAVSYYRASLAVIDGAVKLYISNYISGKWGLERFDVTLF